MIEIRETETFSVWLRNLRDAQAKPESLLGYSAWPSAIRETFGLSVKASANYEFRMARDIACITYNAAQS